MLINIFNEVSFRCSQASLESINFDFIHQEYSAWIQEDDGREVDYEIEIVKDRLPSTHYVVRPPVSYDQNGVFIFDSANRAVRIEFEKIGSKGCRVTCDQMFNPNFWGIIIEALLACLFLRNDSYFCHASAFRVREKNILCPAWRNTGKTNILLDFLMSGAHYIGDDWTLVNRTGALYSLPKRLNILHYNLKYFPWILSNLDTELQPLVDFTNHVSEGKFNLSDNTIQDLKDKSRLRLRPDEIKVKTCQKTEGIDYIFFLTRDIHGLNKVGIEPMSKETLKNKMLEITKFEQNHLLAAYSFFRARTGQKNEYLEHQLARLGQLIEDSLSGVRNIYQVTVTGQECSGEAKEQMLSIINEE